MPLLLTKEMLRGEELSMKIMQSFIHNYMSTVNVFVRKHTQNIKATVYTRSNVLVELYLVIARSGISTAVKR